MPDHQASPTAPHPPPCRTPCPFRGNQYAGFHPPRGRKGQPASRWSVPVVEWHSLGDHEHTAATTFYERYVRTRTPCVLSALPGEVDRTGVLKRLLHPDAELAARPVSVEGASADGHFGSAQRRHRMAYGTFVRERLPTGRFYLTTQYGEGEGEESLEGGHPFQAPLDVLHRHQQDLLPRRLAVMGHLILKQVNLWLGWQGEYPTSSGLHHDFQDNLYLLLAGRKTFHLYSPRDLNHLYLHGKVAGVFPNGLIHYAGQPRVLEDGSFLRDHLAGRVAECEERVQRARVRVRARDANASKAAEAEEALREAEEALELAIDEQLQLELEEGEEGEEEDFSADDDADDDDASDEGEADAAVAAPRSKRARTQVEIMPEDPVPDSFCDVPRCTTDDLAAIRARYPDLAKATKVTVELEAGQALYLPASWFHEVLSSRSPEGGGFSPATSVVPPELHAAINYWYAPPPMGGDGVAFACPYGLHRPTLG